MNNCQSFEIVLIILAYYAEEQLTVFSRTSPAMKLMNIGESIFTQASFFFCPHFGSCNNTTLVFQLEDTVRLFGTLLLLDPIHFPKSEPCLIIGSVCQIGALLGTSLYA